MEQTKRTGGDGGPRSANGRRFEVFVREDEPDPLEHVGTVAAPTPDAAHEEASRLFAWYARDVWVCPAAETYRYSADSLTEEGDSESTPTPDPADEHVDPEPRVYEETEGTPAVAFGGKPVDGKHDGDVGGGERDGDVGGGERDGDVGGGERDGDVANGERDGDVADGARDGDVDDPDAAGVDEGAGTR